MFKADNGSARSFDFELDGKAYSVPSPLSLPIGEILAFADATEKGGTEQARWLVSFFSRHTDGATDSMSVAAFRQLAKAWNGDAELGESQASSD